MKRKRAGRRVLLVEDDAQLVGLARVALVEAGYVVEVAEDGAAAFRALAGHASTLHAVVLDLGLHDMPGGAVLIRAKQLRPDLPVVVATGGHAGPATGADAVIHKPYGPAEIIGALDALIERHAPAAH